MLTITFRIEHVVRTFSMHPYTQDLVLKELAKITGCVSHRQMGHRDVLVWSPGETGKKIARSSKQYAATIPRRRKGEIQHEDQRRDPIMPSAVFTLPEKTAQRYVFLGRPRCTRP
jgi:hypothetical protein